MEKHTYSIKLVFRIAFFHMPENISRDFEKCIALIHNNNHCVRIQLNKIEHTRNDSKCLKLLLAPPPFVLFALGYNKRAKSIFLITSRY